MGARQSPTNHSPFFHQSGQFKYDLILTDPCSATLPLTACYRTNEFCRLRRPGGSAHVPSFIWACCLANPGNIQRMVPSGPSVIVFPLCNKLVNHDKVFLNEVVEVFIELKLLSVAKLLFEIKMITFKHRRLQIPTNLQSIPWKKSHHCWHFFLEFYGHLAWSIGYTAPHDFLWCCICVCKLSEDMQN